MTESAASEITTRSTGIRYGVILGVIGIVYFVGLNLADVDMSKGIAKWGMSLASIVVIFLAQKYFRDNGDGFMTYGQGIGVAFWTGLVSSILSSIFTYIYIKAVDPGYITKIRETAIADMEAKGQSDEQIEMAMKFVNMFTSAEAILIFGIVFGIIGSVIIGLIVSLIMQKPRPEAKF